MTTTPILHLYKLTTGLMGLGGLPAFYLGFSLARQWTEMRQRLGLYTNLTFTAHSPRIWLQAVSVGEVTIAKILIEEILRLIPFAQFIVTSTTTEGLKAAQNNLDKHVIILPFPLDLPWAVWTAVRRIKPHIYVSLETEIWPGLLSTLGSLGITCLILNGRLSQNSFCYYQKIRPLIKATLKYFSVISMIDQANAERIIKLGAEPKKVQVDGNIKYAKLFDRTKIKNLSKLKSLLALNKESPLLTAGSMHTGEEKPILTSFATVLKKYPRAVLAVAPRHIKNVNRWLEACQFFSFSAQRFSSLIPNSPRQPETKVIIIDIMGQLMAFYGLSQAAFLGGSLVSLGGHNPMEPAAWGIPCFWGPSMDDFMDAVKVLSKANVGKRINNATELAQAWLTVLNNPETARAQGAKGRELVARWSGTAIAPTNLILKHLNR